MSRAVKQPFLAWWQLLRIGNVFTAASNVIAGFLISQGDWQPVGPLLVLIAASALLYTAGMVLNDVFDAKLDATERPERPIPSGRISRTAAFVVGWLLLVLGVASAWWASWFSGNPCSGVVGSLLALTVVSYDAGLKSTPLGPWTMGVCRFLNVLLGASSASSINTLAWVFAAIVGVYTLGITYIARSENETSVTSGHRVGEGLIFVSVASLFLFPLLFFDWDYFRMKLPFWPIWWMLVFLFTAGFNWLSEREAGPEVFRRRVTTLLRGFILIDALVILTAIGWVSALTVLSLLIPTWIASRFAPMT